MSLLDDVSIVVTPNGYKAGELYAVKPTVAFGSELSPNVDFTSDITGWESYNSGTASWDSFNGGCMKSVSDGTNHWFARTTNELSGIVANSRYLVTLKVYIPSGYSGGNIYCSTASQFGAQTFTQADSSITDEWQTISTIFYTDADITGRLHLRSKTTDPAASDYVYFDDISIKQNLGADMDVTRATAATRVDERWFSKLCRGFRK